MYSCTLSCAAPQVHTHTTYVNEYVICIVCSYECECTFERHKCLNKPLSYVRTHARVATPFLTVATEY